ncbi:tetratricopeptide repeat protein, partial [Shouchella clausii]
GLCLAQLELLDEARPLFEKTIALDPSHADAYYNLGVVQAASDEAEAALASFNQALAHQPGHLLAGNGKRLIEATLEKG